MRYVVATTFLVLVLLAFAALSTIVPALVRAALNV